MMNQSFLLGVLKKTFWLPKSHMMKVRVCADPPSKITMAALLTEQMRISMKSFVKPE